MGQAVVGAEGVLLLGVVVKAIEGLEGDGHGGAACQFQSRSLRRPLEVRPRPCELDRSWTSCARRREPGRRAAS